MTRLSDPGPAKISSISAVMRADWERRALEDAYYYVSPMRRGQPEEEFDAFGLRDVREQVLADIPTLTGGRDPRSLRLLEIGCGVGRMTRHLAAAFGQVYGVDVSPTMVAIARQRLAGLRNLRLLVNNGVDLSAFPPAFFDVCFSFVVFQHIPEKEVVASYVREAARVLRYRGVFKFQLQGYRGADFVVAAKDTWTGATFSGDEVRALAQSAGLAVLAVSGAGTQYQWVTLQQRRRRPLAAWQHRLSGFAQLRRYLPAALGQLRPAGIAESGPILLLGCAPRPHLERIVADLRSREPDRELWLLNLDDTPMAGLDRVISYRDQGGLWANLQDRRRLLDQLRAAGLSRVVLPAGGGEGFTRSHIAVLGCLLGAPVEVCDESLAYSTQPSGLATAVRYFVRGFVLSRVPPAPRMPPGAAWTAPARRLGSRWRVASRLIPWQSLAYLAVLPLRVLSAGVRALWLLRRLRSLE